MLRHKAKLGKPSQKTTQKMAKQNRRLRRKSTSESRRLPSPPRQAQTSHDQEAVDGILVQIRKTDLRIADEQAGRIQTRPGYEIKVAIPDWDKNRGLLDSIRKGHLAQQKLLTKLQSEGASRPWMSQRFNEVDKAVAAVLTTVAERIRTRRWREKERAEALQRLQDAFRDLQRWAAKATRYCHLAENCTDPVEKETVLDAACLGLLKVGELINKVERMQHGFWEDFSAAHFLDMRHTRNLIGHTDDLEREDVVPLGTGIVQDLQSAIQRTRFPANTGPDESGFMMSADAFRELEPSRPGEQPAPGNSFAMIRLDDHSRLVILRVGRSEDNKLLFSSSVTGTMPLSVTYVCQSDPQTEPRSSDKDSSEPGPKVDRQG